MKNSLIGLSLLLFSCELVVDIKVPAEPPKLTVNGVFEQDSTWHVTVFKSKYILDNTDYQPVQNAIVVIKEDNIAVDTLHYSDFGQYTSSSEKSPQVGKHYELIASAPGFESVSAQSSLPAPVQIANTAFEWKFNQGTQSDYNYVIDVTFKDDPAVENFYEFKLFIQYEWFNPQTQDTIKQYSEVYIYTDDPGMNNESIDGVLFDDKLINGKDTKLRLKGGSYNGDNTKFYLVMRSLNEDLYRYTLTTKLQGYSSGDPFAQPVHVYNNIANGFGIFGGYYETGVKINQ
jgi:hypothetical protein